MLQVKAFVFGPVSENTYVIYNENKQAIIIDPGCYTTNEENQLQQFITENELMVEQLLLTHCHFDHVFGVQWVVNNYKVLPQMHPAEEVLLNYAQAAAERWQIPFDNWYKGSFISINEPATIVLGKHELIVLHTPGHSPGSLSFYSANSGFVLSGDVLFLNSVGRTDLPLCNHDELIQSIQHKLYKLPNETVVYSGHGLKTTIGYEKQSNPFTL
jgi:glyoxylase-like metal-dependent hydrolase (beta-lactamase superfamily II)